MKPSSPPARIALLLPATLLLSALAAPAATQEPNFARSLALTESELFVGQPVNWYGPGTVYAYELDASGAWEERARVVASDAERMDDFGREMALDGNTLAVSAPRKRDGAGAVYLFEREAPGADWRETAILAPSGEGFEEYGVAIHLQGDDLLVGAPALGGTGGVHHYVREGGSWTLEGALRPVDLEEGARFGWSLATDGARLLVGAPGVDEGQGSVLAFQRTPDGAWGAPSVVDLPRPEEGDPARGGWSLLLDGPAAFVGAPGAGQVVALEEGADGWAVAGTLEVADLPNRAEFGYALERVAGELWVGAPGVNGNYGLVYRFTPDGAGEWASAGPLGEEWTEGSSWPLMFGFSVAAAGDRAVIGMPQRDFGEGRAIAIEHGAGGWAERQLLEGEIYRIGETLEPGMECEDGRIEEFPCANIEVVAHMPNDALGGERGAWLNDIWGWTDPETGRDFALVARRDGLSFVEVTDASNPRLVGNLPRTDGSRPSVWRDVKVLSDHAYIVADGAGQHGMQVFDLTRLREVPGAPVEFEPDLTYRQIASAHNVVANEETGYLYIVGASAGGETCGGGLHMVDASDPKDPVFVGCYHDPAGANPRGYTHDAQCVLYRGPDERYHGREICVGSNEREINVADVTDKANPVTLGRGSYPNVGYAHQGWFDPEQHFFYMNDETDTLAGSVPGIRTIIWDLSDLEDPVVAREHVSDVLASAHNLFIEGERMYQSNYGSGFRVFDIGDRTDPREIGFLDSAPYSQDEPGHSAVTSGAWSNFPYFESGVVVFTSVREGLFIVRVTDPTPIS
jgi:choice-of-anchor B domain-containing protein